MKPQNHINLIIAAIAIFAVGISVQQLFNLQFNELDIWIESFGIYAPIIYSFLLFLGLTIPFNPLPDYLVVNLAAYLFTPNQAIWATFIAHSAAITLNYFIARKIGLHFLKRFLTREENKKIKNFHKHITPVRIFSMRWILPLTAVGIDIVSYASGLARVSFWKFYIASIIPWTILNIVFFTSTNYLKQFSQSLILVPGLILALMTLSIYYLARKINLKVK